MDSRVPAPGADRRPYLIPVPTEIDNLTWREQCLVYAAHALRLQAENLRLRYQLEVRNCPSCDDYPCSYHRAMMDATYVVGS